MQSAMLYKKVLTQSEQTGEWLLCIQNQNMKLTKITVTSQYAEKVLHLQKSYHPIIIATFCAVMGVIFVAVHGSMASELP